MINTSDLRIATSETLAVPIRLIKKLPITPRISDFVNRSRQGVIDILRNKDKRLLAIVGPCSIHDPKAAMNYATKLAIIARQLAKELLIVMRVYFEKPRTTVGWKGLINDPYLDNSFNINKGLYIARKLLLDINNLGLPTGTEFLDTTIPQFISDLTTWAAIGARTTESQIHRELVSGLSMPVGFKNSTDGNIKIAIDAIGSAKHAHHFLGINFQGDAAVLKTTGNEDCHIVLRGSNSGPNYDIATILATIENLRIAGHIPHLIVDCSHGNSRKDYNQQTVIVEEISERIKNGCSDIFGIMLESNLVAGRQDKPEIYGQSITDACISWDQTVLSLKQLAAAVRQRRQI